MDTNTHTHTRVPAGRLTVGQGPVEAIRRPVIKTEFIKQQWDGCREPKENEVTGWEVLRWKMNLQPDRFTTHKQTQRGENSVFKISSMSRLLLDTCYKCIWVLCSGSHFTQPLKQPNIIKMQNAEKCKWDSSNLTNCLWSFRRSQDISKCAQICQISSQCELFLKNSSKDLNYAIHILLL